MNLYHLYQSFESSDITNGFRIHISPVRQKTAWDRTVSQWGMKLDAPPGGRLGSDTCENSSSARTSLTRGSLVSHLLRDSLPVRGRVFGSRTEQLHKAPSKCFYRYSARDAGSWAARLWNDRWDVQPIRCSVRSSERFSWQRWPAY